MAATNAAISTQYALFVQAGDRRNTSAGAVPRAACSSAFVRKIARSAPAIGRLQQHDVERGAEDLALELGSRNWCARFDDEQARRGIDLGCDSFDLRLECQGGRGAE